MTSKRATLGVRHRDAALESGDTSPQSKWRPYPKYKDSGVEWLGEIPAHWEVPRLKSITKEHKQGFYTEQAYVDEGVKLARITDIDDRANVHFNSMPYVQINSKEERAFRLAAGDVLFARSGTIGRFGIVYGSERAVFASYLIRFRFIYANIEFLRYAFDSKYFKDSLVSSLHGGANQNVHAENIKAQSISLPPYDEQLKITAYLLRETAKIDVLIEKKERLIELLQEKRTALITQAVTKGLDPNVPMKDSGVEWLGEIPAHWKVYPFKRLFSTIYRYPTYFGIEYVNEGVKEIRGEALSVDGHIIKLEDQRYIPKELSEKFNRTILEEGDLVMSVRGTMGKIAYVEKTFAGSNITANLLRLSPRRNLSNGPYLVKVISSIYFDRQLDRQAPQTTIKTITMPQLAVIPIALPPKAEQLKTVSFLDREMAKIDALVAKIQEAIDRLKEYRTALISAAVTGKIDVRGEVAQ